MRALKPRVSALYLSAVAECKTAGELLPEEYAWLYDAATRAIDVGNECPALLEVPVSVGNVVLYPLTIGAKIWWKTYGQKWWGEQADADAVVSQAWLLAHSRDSRMFERLTSRPRCALAIMAWQLGIARRVTVAELAWGISRLFGHKDYVDVSMPGEDPRMEEREAAGSADWGALVARLCATYHRPPEYFLWQIGEPAACELLRKAPLPPGMKRDEEPDAGLEEFRAIVRRIKLDAAKRAGE